MPEFDRPERDNDFYFVSAEVPQTAVGRIIELVKTRTPR
jgi:exodeoxyribonuclease V alpha subunit